MTELNVDAAVQVERQQLLKSLLSTEWLCIQQGDITLRLDMTGDVDFESTEVAKRLDRAGALDQARAEGFAAGLFLATSVCLSGETYPDLEALYPETVENLDADEMVDELEDSSEPEHDPVSIEEAKVFLDQQFDNSVIESSKDDTDLYVALDEPYREAVQRVIVPGGWETKKRTSTGGMEFHRLE